MSKDNEKVLFSAKTRYTYEEYLKMNKFHFYRKNVVYISFLIAFIIILGFMGVANIFLGGIVEGVICLALFVYFILFIILMPRISTRSIYKSDKLLNDENVENSFKFYDNYFVITNQNSTSKIDYNKIYRVYETKTNFYFYLNKRLVYIIKKDDFKNCNLQDFRWLLQRKYGKYYIIKM